VRQAREIAERKDNKLWLAKVHWADGAIAEHRAAWSDAIAALAHAHALFATAKSNVDDTAVLADIARVATRGGDAVATLGAERSLAALVDAARADPERATLQPLVALQARYMRGERNEAIAALQALLDANAQRTDWTPRLDVLLQLGRWRLAQDDPRDALALLPMLAPWLEQQPDAIELQIAILRATGNAAGADAAQTRLDHLLASPDLTIEDALLHPPATPDAPPAAAK
jgi:tetratricopeptide (TPR) repeat protein